MQLFFCFVTYALFSCVKGQSTQPYNYSCYQSTSPITFTLSSLDHSAQQTSTNCSLSQCNVGSTNNSSCRSPQTPCFDYRTSNNGSYCAPGIACSILTPCDTNTNQCASNTFICIVNSCCSPQAVCVPLSFTTVCSLSAVILNSTGWSSTRSMNSERSGHIASVLSNGNVLVAGGWNGLRLQNAELYDPTTETWTTTGSMNTERSFYTGSLLLDGNVLVTGSEQYGNPLNSTEVYNVTTGVWTVTGNMHYPRAYHAAAQLANGSVLVTGGGDPYSAELYEPLARTWTLVNTMNYARNWHTTSVLRNGKVLAVAGISLTSSELYDPSTGNWTPTGNLTNDRYFHTASVLTDGKVLVAGGVSGTTVRNTAEIYDPSTENWALTGSMNFVRRSPSASVLSNGKVLVCGGSSDYHGINVLNSCEVYDPSTGMWTITNSMHDARAWHTVSVLSNGKILVVGGIGSFGYLNSAELYSYS